MGKMLKDIAHFLMVFVIMMGSFAVSLHKLYNHYEGQTRTQDGETIKQSNAFVRWAPFQPLKSTLKIKSADKLKGL